MNMYLLPTNKMRPEDAQAAIKLLRDAYEVIKFDLAPLIGGLIYQTKAPVAPSDLDTLGMVPWE